MKLDPKRMAKNIEIWPISKLKPYDKNPKLHPEDQIASICKSITAFGWTNPILVHSKFGIVAGHGRYMAASKMGIEDVPVICLDYLSPIEAKAYLLRDNKEGDTGYNEELLAAVFLELEEANVDLELTGFSDDYIAKLLNPEVPLPKDGHGNTREAGNEEEADIVVTIGEYRFPVKRQVYLDCVEAIKQKHGFEKDSVIAEMKRRLKL